MATHYYSNYNVVIPPSCQSATFAPDQGGYQNWDSYNGQPSHGLFKWKFDSFFFDWSIEEIEVLVRWGRILGLPSGNGSGYIKLVNSGHSYQQNFTVGPSTETKTWTWDGSAINIAHRVINVDTEVWFYFEGNWYYRAASGQYAGISNCMNGNNHYLDTLTGPNPPGGSGIYIDYNDTGQQLWYFMHTYGLDPDPVVPIEGRLINMFNRVEGNLGPRFDL